MKNFLIGTALATACLVGGPALASSHREAPNITRLSKVDNTDVYAFRSYEPGRDQFVTIIANFQPGENPNDGPNYYTMDPDAVYEIHIDNVGDAKEHITYQFKFTNTLQNGIGIPLTVGGVTQPIALRFAGAVTAANSPNLAEVETYTVTQIIGDRRTGTRTVLGTFNKPLDNVGTKTTPNYDSYANSFISPITFTGTGCGTAGKVFVGQRQEAFAVNLGEIFDLVNTVPVEGPVPFGAYKGGIANGINQSRDNDNLIGKKNVTSIALEVPISCVNGGTAGNGTIGVWSTSSLPQAVLRTPNPTYAAPSLQGGAYVQVSRLGMPLVNELVIGLKDKDLFNAVKPTSDGALASYVTNPTFPALLDALFRAPVNAALGAPAGNNIAPSNFPRNDLVTTFLTGFKGVNQLPTVTPSEMIRLNTLIAPTVQANQNTFGIVGGDLAGYPNGRRPGDDTVDITLRVAMGRLCYPVTLNGPNNVAPTPAPAPTDLGLCTSQNAPSGMVPYTDGAPLSARDLQNVFPYLNTPIPGAPNSARLAAAAVAARP